MFGKNTSRWFILLFVLMLGLRVGIKYYRGQQKPSSEVMMEKAMARRDSLVKALQANEAVQRARGFVPVRADSTMLAHDSTARAK